jgi:hypothetical protein
MSWDRVKRERIEGRRNGEIMYGMRKKLTKEQKKKISR